MYEDGGITYIYLCYGIHSLLNIVTGNKGFNGPGKLIKTLSIDKNFNCIDLSQYNDLWLEDSGQVSIYHTSLRIGIDYACDYYRNIHWRYILNG